MVSSGQLAAKLRVVAAFALCLGAAGLGLLTFRAGSQSPGESPGGLTMEARAILVEHEGEQVLRIVALLVNDSEEQNVVLTDLPEISLARDAAGPVADFSFTGRETMNGRLMIPPLSPLASVTLRPGEATRLENAMHSGRVAESLNGGETIRVRYIVSDEWGERFGLWHGIAETEVVVSNPTAG